MDYRKVAEEFCDMRVQDARRVTEIEQAITVKGEANVLFFLSEYKEGVLAGQISRELGLSASRGTNIFNSLEKKGLIERKNDSADKRKVYISLTEKGKKLNADKHEELIDEFEQIFRELGENDTKEYIRIMKRFVEIVGKHKK